MHRGNLPSKYGRKKPARGFGEPAPAVRLPFSFSLPLAAGYHSWSARRGNVARDVLWLGRYVKQYLKENRVSFKEINIERDPSAARDVAKKTSQSGVLVVKIGSKWIVGLDNPTIERELARS